MLTGYITVKEASAKWGLSTRWVNKLCQDKKIPGVEMFGGVYAIPENAEKPTEDRRITTGEYKNWRQRYGRTKKDNVTTMNRDK